MNGQPTMTIEGRPIGAGHPCYVVAEVSANHGQNLDKAFALIAVAKEAGADAVKVQTYTPDTMTIDASAEWFTVPEGTAWSGTTLYDLYSTAYTPWEWHASLKARAREEGLTFFSTPFDVTAVDFLSQLEVPAFKIASFELVDIPLLRKVAATGKPVILSTGMATFAEISEAVQTLRDGGAADVALLKCTSAYPARATEMNLRTIPNLRDRFNAVVGLSDHTLGSACALGSVALGATIIEKHLTLSRGAGGPDAAFSMEPDEFERMVVEIRQLEAALGDVCYERTPDEQRNACFRRSLFVVADVNEGETFTPHNVRSIRPAHGLPPRDLPAVLGRVASRHITRGTPMSWGLIADGRNVCTLRVRRATDQDSRLLWHWVNDPLVRKAAFNSDPITWRDHLIWFDARLRSVDTILYVLETHEGIPVGLVRFDMTAPGAAEVDLSIALEWRGHGLGAKVLRLACDAFWCERPVKVVAHIRPENSASLRTFERAGFAHAGMEPVGVHIAVRMERERGVAAGP
jgi:N-acetylneuraminate synthase